MLFRNNDVPAALAATSMLFLAGCLLCGDPLTASAQTTDTLTKDAIERDLSLEVELLSGDGVQPGQAIKLGVQLKNTSAERIYPVVRPGDGSSVGSREPHVFYTAWIDTGDGQWTEVPKIPLLRCGVFDAEWQNDIAELWPGKSITLKDWLAPPEMVLDLQQAGMVRLHVHYRYRGGNVGKDLKTGRTFAKGKMQGVPAFEIVSKPVEFEVLRPIDLVVTVKKPLKAKAKTRLSEILDVNLQNGSKGGIEVKAPTLSADARLEFEIDAKRSAPPTVDQQDQQYGKKQILGPGEEVGILGDAVLSNGLDGTWRYPEPGTVKLRAVYRTSTFKPGAVIKSEWVEVKVVK